jgi:hypothetical protein
MLLGACDDSPKIIDPFPIEVDLSVGPTLLAATEGGGPAVAITLDVLSPITVLDSYRSGGEVGKPERHLVNLTLLGLDGEGNATVPRVLFPDTAAYDLHPCAREGLPPAVCRVGLGESTREIYGVLGADILARSSIRFDFPLSILRFFPDAAGSASERTLACDAVFESPYSGGGTLLIGGSEVRYGANRPTLGTCVHTSTIEEPAPDESEVGTDMHLAISTAQGPTILSRSAYTRFAASGAATPLGELPATTLHLLSGPVPALLGEVAYMAIVGEVGGDSDRRGPCRELYANARMRSERTCSDDIVDCPCPDSQDSCKAGAAIEITRTIQVAVVDDALPLLQALRDELRPRVPELDGVIGVDALSDLRVEFDFPNNRLLMRCLDTENCFTRQQVRSPNTLLVLDKCRAAEDAERAAPGPDAGVEP